MKKVILLAAVTIVCGMLLFIPSTVALFTGQHTFDSDGRECADCHTVIATEMAAGDAHESFTCQDCHQADFSDDNTDPYTDSGAHSAIAIECLDCHGGTDGMTGAADVSSSITDADEAHKPIIDDAATSTGIPLQGANEACIACHTSVTVDVTLTYTATTLTLAATQGTDGTWASITWAATA